MIELKKGSDRYPGRVIDLGGGLILSQDDDGRPQINLDPDGGAAIKVQDGDTAGVGASTLVFQSSVVSVSGGVATFDLDGRYLNATNINAGTLADARLSTNVPLKDAASNIFTGYLGIARSLVGDPALRAYLAADAYPRIEVRAGGTVLWGSGAAAVDTNLYRSAANVLKTDDNFQAASIGIGTVEVITAARNLQNTYVSASDINRGTLADARLSSNVALENAANTFTDTQHIATDAGYNGDYALAIKQTADTNWRLFIQNQGTLLWGSGAGAADTNLYRSAANTLKTDDALEIGNSLTTVGRIRVGEGQQDQVDIGADGTNANIELGLPGAAGGTPFIDFHFGKSVVQDYNVRLINDADQRLSLIGAARITGLLDMSSQRIVNVADPVNMQDAATRAFVMSVGAGKTTFADLWNDMVIEGAKSQPVDAGAKDVSIQVDGGTAYVNGRRATIKSSVHDVTAMTGFDQTVNQDWVFYMNGTTRVEPGTTTETETYWVTFGVQTLATSDGRNILGVFTWDTTAGITNYRTDTAMVGIATAGDPIRDPYAARLFAYASTDRLSRVLRYMADGESFWPTATGLNLGRTDAWANRWGTFYGTAVDITGSATIGGDLALTGTMTSGSVPDARLSSNVPLKNAANTFTSAGSLLFDGQLFPLQLNASAGDAFTSFLIRNTGQIEWGSGSVARDTNLYRSAADTLKTDDTFEANYLRLFGNLVGNVGSGTTYKEFDLIAMHGSVVRWIMRLKGADADGNFSLFRYNDAGAFLGTPFSINRSSGLATFETTPYVGADQIWHRGNDGTGSTLDADLLDGVHGSGFLRRDTANGISSYANTITFPSDGGIEQSTAYKASLQVYNATAGAGAFMQFHVGSDYAVYFGLDGSTNDLAVGGWSMGAVKHKVWHAGNDGVGSGLNADLLDGLDSGQFLRSDVSDTMTGDLNFGTRTGQRINLWSTTYGFGIQNYTQYVRTEGNFAVHKGGTHTDLELNPNGGVTTLWTERSRADALHVRNGMWVHQHTGGSHRDYRINAGLALPGREVNNNPEFHDRLSGYTVYDNNGSGRVVLQLETVADTANSSARRMRINYDPARSTTATSPGFGGFYLNIGKAGALAGSSANFKQYRQGNRLVYRLWAWVPSGRTIQWASNGVGPNSGGHWATSQDGKSAWREYVWVQTIGAGGVDGDYATTGFFYISGGTDVAFDWYVGRCTVTAVDEADGPAYSPGLRVGHYLDQALGDGEIIAGGKIYAQKGLHINTEALWLYDMGGTGYGNMAVQGRVLSASNNIHLSPPNGANVVINTDYRGAGGATGTAGLIATGDIQGREFKSTSNLFRGSDNAYMQIDNGAVNFLTSAGAALTARVGKLLISSSYGDAIPYPLTVKGNIYADGGWFRVSGNQGYYFETHGGGWYMTNTSDLLVYNAKGIANIGTRGLTHSGTEATDGSFGLYWANTRSLGYAIYREAGAWTAPYPDLVINFHTGIKIGAHKTYGGTRFYNMDTVQAGVVEVMSIADGDEDVRVKYNLHVTGSAYATTYYTTSSRKVKHGIRPWEEDATGILRGVRVVRFRYDNDPAEEQVGFIAEDTHPLLSSATRDRMKLGTTVGLLLAGFQDLDRRLENLEGEVQVLKNLLGRA